MFDPREKIAVLIDGANLYSASRALGFDIDYRRLLSDFRQKGYLVRAIYYTALAEDQEYSSLRPLIDWLDYNGYRVVTKPLQGIHRRAGAAQGQGQHGHRARGRCHGDGRAHRPFRPVLRRRRFPLSGRGAAAEGQEGDGRLDAQHAAADDRRRPAPAGGPLPGAFDARRDPRPRPGAAAAASAARARGWTKTSTEEL